MPSHSPTARPDRFSALIPGPWEHRFIPANGARFHVALAGEGPLILLLHGFPEFWWAWRHQLPYLADEGFRVAAMDLRGYAGSDKPPGGYDAYTLAADVASVIRSLGESQAVVIGHGIGGWLAWTLPVLHRGTARGVAVLGCPHPRAFYRGARLSPRQIAANLYLVGFAPQFLPERRISRDSRYVDRLLHQWSARDSAWPSREEVSVYTQALAEPFAAHSAVESYRWLLRTGVNASGRTYLHRLQQLVDVPVLQLHGVADRAIVPQVAASSATYVASPYRWVPIQGAGHFVHEEAPGRVNRELANWLHSL